MTYFDRVVYSMFNNEPQNNFHLALRILSVVSDKHLELVKEQIEMENRNSNLLIYSINEIKLKKNFNK